MDDPTPATIAEIPDTLTITLRQPVEAHGIAYDKLDLSEPTVGQMIGWDKLSGVAAQMAAVSAVAGIPMLVVKEIGARDLLAAANFIGAFALTTPPATDAEAPETLTVTLRKPIEHDGATITELRLAEPKAGHLIEWDKVEGVAADCALIAAVTGLPESAIRKVRARDFVTAAVFLANFLEPGRAAGDRS